MRALVTGATGKVGHAIASALLDRRRSGQGACSRSKARGKRAPGRDRADEGDVTDAESLAAAVEGCELVFNSMGMPEQWVKDEAIFDQVNAIGSGELAAAAKRGGIRRFVHTSTHDVFHADTGERFDETMLADYPKGTAYERSKQHAEELVLAERDGMEVELAPTSLQTLINYGLLLLDMTRFGDARHRFLDAVDYHPTSIEARIYAASACFECGDARLGESDLVPPPETWPALEGDLRHELVMLLIHVGRIPEAEQLLDLMPPPPTPRRSRDWRCCTSEPTASVAPRRCSRVSVRMPTRSIATSR